jgi:hypothetical protein
VIHHYVVVLRYYLFSLENLINVCASVFFSGTPAADKTENLLISSSSYVVTVFLTEKKDGTVFPFYSTVPVT